MNKQCAQCNKSFKIFDEDRDFYSRIDVPDPTLCSDCRAQRRLAFRNHWTYYKRKCDSCQKTIVSVYDPDRIHNVYCVKCWWGDGWDATDYGRDFDFSRSLAEQFRELHEAVPKLAMMNDDSIQSQNCEYSNDFAFGKNVYMVVAAWYDENCLYGFQLIHSKDCVDCSHTWKSELSYDCSACENCFGCEHCHEVYDSRDCIYGYDLKNCDNCILSAGLRNKQYCIWNQQYTKSEFERKKAELQLDSWKSRQQLQAQFEDFLLKIPRKHASLINSEECSGNYLKNSTNAKHSFIFPDIENGKYLVNGDGAKDSYDLYCTGHAELCYDSLTPDDSYNVAFSNNCWKSQNILYSENCHASKDLVACVGMKKGKNAILNRNLTQADYEVLRTKVVAHLRETGEWGQFLQPNATLFAYNETAANEFYPLKRSAAEQLGYTWIDKLNDPGEVTLQWTDVPDSILELDGDMILNQTVQCIECNKAFRILKEEIDFYIKRGIPLPHHCMTCRYRKRRQRVGPFSLWQRQCMCTQVDHGHNGLCANQFETTYSPERKEIVYCQDCYKKEMY